MTTTPTPRPVESPEDRMRHATQPEPYAEPVLPETAYGTASFRTYIDDQERARLDAEAARASQERDDALDDLRTIRGERDALRDVLADRDRHHGELHNRINALENDLRSANRAVREAIAERDRARQVLAAKRVTITALAAELGDAQDLIAVVDDLAEQLDRARARYATRQDGQPLKHVSVLGNCIACGSKCPNGRCPNNAPADPGSPAPRAQDEPEREEVRWAYRWIGTDGQVYDEMDATDNAIETGEQRAHRIAAKRLTGTVRGEVLRYRVLTMPAEVVATYPAEREADRLAAEAAQYRWTPEREG